MSEKKNKNPYQHTLNLQKTDFPIRANAVTKEPELLEKWKKEDLFHKTWEHNKDKEKFVLHDGPPYANGNIHMGHVLNKVLKDFVTKFKRMEGYHVPVKPGWDCHGLPIEIKVESAFAKAMADRETSQKVDRVEFKKECRKYAQKWVDVQREEFKEIGVLMDWENPYLTMAPEYEADILRSLASFVDQGYIERKGKTVPWCASCQTVLASAEIEHEDRKDPSIYVLFPFDAETSKQLFSEEILKQVQDDKPLVVNLLVWTTTPWTLPLNRAVVLNPKAKYVMLALRQAQGERGGDKQVDLNAVRPEPVEGYERGNNKAIIVAKDLADKICGILGIEKKVLAEFDSKIFENQKVNHTFIPNLKVPVLLDNMVLLDEGTACLHSAPGCGPEDYLLGIKNNLEIFSPISPDGKYTKGIEPKELEGMPVVDGQIWVLRKLKELGVLLHKESIRHSYPHCWRCHKGLIFRATDQWFCDLQKNFLVEKALEETEKIGFMPEFGRARLRAFVGNRPEWCISRQKIWGVPIPALLCKKCDHAFIDSKFIKKVADGVEKEGVEFWDKITIEQMIKDDFISKDFKCTKCGNNDLNNFRKETDILDVWFDSGVSHYAVLQKDKKNLGIPADIYLEGSDQHRGWFQSSLLTSMTLNNKTCTNFMLTHGFILDEKGRKMSKSLGNSIAPADIIKKYSRDIIRLWVAAVDYQNDVAVSENILKNVSEVYRKIRNTCRFIISNLYDFDIQKDAVPLDKLLKIDQYALANLYEMNKKVIQSYQEHNFAAVYYTLNNYCVNDLSSVYLDTLKDRLYVEKADGLLRRSGQTVMYYILDALTRLMAPLLSFLSEEIWQFYNKENTDSVHLQNFADIIDVWNYLSTSKMPAYMVAAQRGLKVPTIQEVTYSIRMQGIWNILEEIRAVVLKAIEEKRTNEVVKHSLEAKVKVYLDPNSEEIKAINDFVRDLSSTEDVTRFFKDWFIVSQFEFAASSDGLQKTTLPWVFVDVDHADGDKCPRCWQWSVTDNPEKLCKRCLEVL